MKAWKKLLVPVACSGLFCFGLVNVLPAQEAASVPKTVQPLQTSVSTNQNSEGKITELPDSPGATLSNAAAAAPQVDGTDHPLLLAQSAGQTSSSQTSSSQDQSSQPVPQSQSSTSQSQQTPPRKQEPVGTAAAEAPKTTGVAASQPAGLAIAPAKQRRTRTIILRTGAIIGAGVAVGSVIALTAGTSSKPPGAR